MLERLLRRTLQVFSILLTGLAAGNAALAQTTLTLTQGQNTYAGTTDAWISDSFPDTNKGADGALSLRGEPRDSALMRFAIFAREGGPVPDNAAVISARLSLYKFSGPDAVFKASRLLKSWSESEVTFNVAAIGLPWTVPGANGSGSDYLATSDGQGTGVDANANNCADGIGYEVCWLNIDVTSGVQAFAGGTPNFGWKIAQLSSSVIGNYKNFNSSENNNFTAFRPKLTVTYVGISEELTARLSATPTSGPASLPVTFDASASTAGSSSITSLRLQFGDATEATWSDKSVQQSHTYTSAATYTATLTVTDSSGATSTATQTIIVTAVDGPTAQLVATPVAGTLSATFNASGSTPGGAAITGLRLAFGDSTDDATWTDKDQLQPHTYAAAGTYQATLTVTDASNRSHAKTVPVTVTGGETVFLSDKMAIAQQSGFTRATFHSMSLYWNPPGFNDTNPPPGNQIFVRYRRATEDSSAPGFAWKQAWPMWYDVRNSTTGWGTLPYQFRGRGSVVYLTPGTRYIFELGTGANYEAANFTHYLEGTTRAETFAEVDAPDVQPREPGNGPLIIEAGGDPATQTYMVYDGLINGIKSTIQRGGANSTDPDGDFKRAIETTPDASFGIVVKASFVILRNVVVKGAALAGIFIHPNVTNVIIEDCEVSDWAWRPNGRQPPSSAWGTVWGATVGRNEAGGIMLGGNNSLIVVQRNKIFDPHLGTSPWDFDHPIGPIGISIYHAGQQNVFRYNEIYSTSPDKRRWYLDAISGTDNFSDKGVPGSDSDVYHNYLRNMMDDGIEAEGGGLNVRVWGNYIDHSNTGVATTTVHFGPTYVFRNVINRLRKYHTRTVMEGNEPRLPENGIAEPDDDFFKRGEAFKAYGAARECLTCLWWGGGRRYFFHNTQLQQPRNTYNPMQQWGDLGASGGIFGGTRNGEGMRETWSRNNILDTYRPGNETVSGGLGTPVDLGAGGTATNNFNFDLWNGNPPPEANGVQGRPTYRSGHGWMAFPRLSGAANEPPEFIFGSGLGVGIGNFQLNSSSPGLSAGALLPNFNFDIDNLPFARKSGVVAGGNPDLGAHDSASPEEMKFGLSAGN
jgi:PKD repeat protein